MKSPKASLRTLRIKVSDEWWIVSPPTMVVGIKD